MNLKYRLQVKALYPLFLSGTISDENRILLERELLTDSEALVEFLDFKRKMEFAELEHQHPSPFLWKKLSERLSLRKRHVLPFSVGVAAVAVVIFLFFNMKSRIVLEETQSSKTLGTEILFDSSSEHPTSSNVL